MRRILLLFFAALPAFGQANLGPITTPRLNGTFYAGSILFPTITSALTAACASTGGVVLRGFGVTTSDTPTSATGGCATVEIVDQSTVFTSYYTYSGGVYVAGPQTVNGALSVTGAATFAGSLSVAGTTSFTGASFSSSGPALFSGNLGASLSGAGIYVGTAASVYPYMAFSEVSAGTNLKYWDVYDDSSSTLHFRALADSLGAANDWLNVTRGGYVPALVTFPVSTTFSAGANAVLLGATTPGSVAATALSASGATTLAGTVAATSVASTGPVSGTLGTFATARTATYVSAATTSGTAVTLVTLPNVSTLASGAAIYQVSASMAAGTGAPANYAAYAVIAVDGGVSRLMSSVQGSNLTISLSGMALQVTQTSGGTAAVQLTLLEIE